ncbi:MAG: tetratricopeptide repeat protein, partial [Bacteroidales bacterium]
MKKICFALLLMLVVFKPSHAQEVDYKELFLAAESYYLFEEFNEALPLYMRIHRQFPENDNINFKIGVCYLNDPFQKDKSISYLEDAVENINPKYKENNFKEEAAPLESLFHLGNAYRVNNQLDKAKEYYQKFLEKMDPEVYDAELVQDQIDACDVAKKLMSKPVDYDVESLGGTINTRFSDVNAVVSGDETRMAFISELQFYDAVFYTEKKDGEWTPPRNIIPELGVDGDVYPTSMSYDGTEMFIYRNDEFIGNLYSSKLVDGKWTP